MTIDGHTFVVRVTDGALQARLLRPEGLESDENTPTLVLLHDGLGSVAQWRNFPAALVRATGLPALLYDRCGSGCSDPSLGPGDSSHFNREMVRLTELLRICSIQQPILLGHSDGATIALQFAATEQKWPLGVISLAAHLFAEEVTLAEIRRTGEHYRNHGLRAKLMRYHGDKTDQLFTTWTAIWEDALASGWNIEERLQTVRCPILALQGDRDEYGTLRQLQAITANVKGPCAQVILPGCGHFPHLAASGETLAALSPFILGLIRPS